MNLLVYLALLLPAVIMIIVGAVISSKHRDSTIASHHFAGNFNITKSSKRIVKLFAATGIAFSLCGFLLYSGNMIAGFVALSVVLVLFIIAIIKINGN